MSDMGTQRKVFGFIDKSDASRIMNAMKYHNYSVKRVGKISYTIDISPPNDRLYRPLSKNLMTVESISAATGIMYAGLNNIGIVIISDVVKRPQNKFILNAATVFDVDQIDKEIFSLHMNELLAGKAINYKEYIKLLDEEAYDENEEEDIY